MKFDMHISRLVGFKKKTNPNTGPKFYLTEIVLLSKVSNHTTLLREKNQGLDIGEFADEQILIGKGSWVGISA